MIPVGAPSSTRPRRVARLSSSGDGGARPRAGIRALAGLVLVALAAGGCRGERFDGRLRDPVILVTIDTLRADHLGAYGYPRPTSPFLDELARRGVVFDRAVSACSHTAPSHASIMTSLQPLQHGLLKNGQALDPSLYTLAEMFRDAGYDTAAFTSVGFLGELAPGFDVMDARWRSGDRTVARALAWLRKRSEGAGARGRPFFLWVHLYDVHQLPGPRAALRPDEAALESWSDEERERFLTGLTTLRGVDPGFYPDRRTMIDRYTQYDAGVRFDDRQVRRLYERVETANPQAIWIVTSDHGEGLGEHDYDEHGKYIYEEQLHVPLIVVGGPGSPRRIDRLVRLIDIYPTLAGWLGAPAKSGGPPLQGYPLFSPRAVERDLPPRLAFAERRPKDGARHRLSWEPGDVYSLESLALKYIFHSQGRDELYDLRSDPLELHNLIDEPSKAGKAMRKRLLGYVRALADGALGPAADESAKHAAELEALGYL